MYDKDKLKARWASSIQPLFTLLLRLGLKPIHITGSGSLLIAIGCLYLLGERQALAFGFLAAGGLCDAIDGAYARHTGQVTAWGGFFDSVIDRYNEFLLAGTVLFTLREQTYLYYYCFAFFLGISLMSYTRALYEKNEQVCPANPFEYFERGCLFLFFLVIDRLDLWLITVALGTHYFVATRIYRFYRVCHP